MGNSTTTDQEDAKQSISMVTQRHRMIERIERFVAFVYVSSPKIEAMWLILSSKLGQKAFQAFVKQETSESFLALFLEVSDMLSSKECEWETALEYLARVKQRLQREGDEVADMLPELLKNEVFLDFATDPDVEKESHTILVLLERLQNEVVSVMARDHFHRFIESKYYKTWRAAESSHATATTFEDASITASEFSSASRKSSARSQSMKYRFRMRSVVQPSDLSAAAFSQIKGEELQEILRCRECWMSALLAAVEALPVAFSLASAQKSGFPLIYVNKCFERITGFAREDVVGRGCSEFLYCETTEENRSESLALAMRSNAVSKEILTNRTAEGKHFKCLFALKPILDTHGVVQYWLGLHFDVTREVDGFVSKLQLASELLDMLPEQLLRDEEAETLIDDEGSSRRRLKYGGSSKASSVYGGSAKVAVAGNCVIS